MRFSFLLAFLALFAIAFTSNASATTIYLDAGIVDGYKQIEAAQAGDEVILAPGTYNYRVYLSNKGTAASPILIHAQDPSNPPVWDLNGDVTSAAGDYTASDKDRGCWQVFGGAYYEISGITIQNCSISSYDSSGLRYYGGTTGLVLRNMLFQHNDNGLTGGDLSSDAVVESCEFNANGAPKNPGEHTHNIYIYGGTFAMRYSYVHDSAQGENLHIRAMNSTIEANWIARAQNYEIDLMTDDDVGGGYDPPIPAALQTMNLIGNVIIQAASPSNNSQVIVAYNDEEIAAESFALNIVNNTFIGNGGPADFVHLSNAAPYGAKAMSAVVDNNIIYGNTHVSEIDDSSTATLSGSNNWLATGTATTGLTGTIFGSAPGFTNAAGFDYTLATGSACIAAANGSITASLLPTWEYYENQTTICEYRDRATVHDLGAFESTTTGPGLDDGGINWDLDSGSSPPPANDDAGGTTSADAGHHGKDGGTTGTDGGTVTPGTDASVSNSDGGSTKSGGGEDGGGTTNGPEEDGGPGGSSSKHKGCSVTAVSAQGGEGAAFVALGFAAMALSRRRRRG